MDSMKPLSTPLSMDVKLSNHECPQIEFMSKLSYQFNVNSLMYATIATRPNIVFAIGAVSIFLSKPGKKPWEGVKNDA